MIRAKHLYNRPIFINTIFYGKHSNHKIKFFCFSSYGKHSKNEIIKYNPLYAKYSTCVGVLAVAISFLAVNTLGKYRGTLASADTARVAKYVLEVSEQESSITEFIPNTTRSIDFEVKNFEGELENIKAMTEVKTRYKIKLKFPNNCNLPIDHKLYRIYSEDNMQEINLVNGESDYIEMGISSVTQKYRLEFTWRSGNEDIFYQYLTDNINITIESEQMD